MAAARASEFVRRVEATLTAMSLAIHAFCGDGRGVLATQKAVCQDVVDPTIAGHGGRIVKTSDVELRFIGYTGDACRLLFDGTMPGFRDTWKREQHNCRFSLGSVIRSRLDAGRT